VATSVAAKARIVGADERETGARALLNLGHTFAHALETLAGYDGALLHGEAVAIGMAMAFEFSGRIGLCPEADVARVRRALSSAGLETDPRRLPFAASLTPDAVLDLMAQDKKVEGGRLTLILARGVGQAFVAKDAPRTELRAFLADALETTP
jgi:3-dehydroquinate synthetase